MAYRGDPQLRSKTEFLLEYEGVIIRWKSWDQDLFDSIPYEPYCRTVPQLRPMVLTVLLSNAEALCINHQPIIIVRPRMIGYMDLRWFPFDWYAGLSFPDEDTTTYVLKYRYGDYTNDNQFKIRIKFDITGDEYVLNHYSVLMWGSLLALTPGMVLCDRTFIRRYPHIMGNQEERQPG